MPPADAPPPPVTANRRAFTVLVRNALFHRVELAARKRWFALGELDADDGWTADRWSEALVPYFAEHGSLGIGPEARSPAMLLVEEHADRWDVRQILDDPDAEHAWAITAVVDLPASVEAGTAVVRIVDVAGP